MAHILDRGRPPASLGVGLTFVVAWIGAVAHGFFTLLCDPAHPEGPQTADQMDAATGARQRSSPQPASRSRRRKCARSLQIAAWPRCDLCPRETAILKSRQADRAAPRPPTSLPSSQKPKLRQQTQ